MSRHRARVAVMETLYQMDSRRDSVRSIEMVEDLCLEALQRHNVTGRDSVDFGHALARSTWENMAETDRVISELSRSWALHRIGRLERSIMRMALEEMWRMNIPPSVAINEAVELTKQYVSDRAASFVNGILGACVEGPPALDCPRAERGGVSGCTREEEVN